jgi:hypothetical protein
MLNHLIECVRVPVAVKTKAHVEKVVPEPDIGTPTSFTAESTTAAVKAGQKRKRPQQTTSSVQKTRKYTFSKSEQDTFDEDVMKMTVSAGWTWNSLGDPEVRSFFTKYIPGSRLPNPDLNLFILILCQITLYGGSSHLILIEDLFDWTIENGWEEFWVVGKNNYSQEIEFYGLFSASEIADASSISN